MEIDGTVIVASYEAKAYGIKTGTKIYEASAYAHSYVRAGAA